MKTFSKKTLSLSLIAIAAMTYSCKKTTTNYEDLPEVPAENKEILDSAAATDAAFTHVYTVVHTEVSNVEDQSFKTGNTYSGASPDPNVIITKEIDSTDKANKFVSKVTIEYPVGGSTWNGLTAKGKIIVTKNGRIDKKGTLCNITFEKFSVAGWPLTATATMENKGFVNAEYTMHLDVTNGKLGGAVAFELHHDIVFTMANGSFNMSMTGTQKYTVNGAVTNVALTSALLRTFGCGYIKQGAAEYTCTGKDKIIIDYGKGECDNKSTVIVGVKTYQYGLN